MSDKTLRKRRGVLIICGFALLGIVAIFYILARNGIGIPCLFHQVTGLQCPGCGNSRAALALLRLDFSAALQYNFLFPLEILYIGWVIFYCCRSYLKTGRFSYKPPAPLMDLLVLILVVLWWIVRNLI